MSLEKSTPMASSDGTRAEECNFGNTPSTGNCPYHRYSAGGAPRGHPQRAPLLKHALALAEPLRMFVSKLLVLKLSRVGGHSLTLDTVLRTPPRTQLWNKPFPVSS